MRKAPNDGRGKGKIGEAVKPEQQPLMQPALAAGGKSSPLPARKPFPMPAQKLSPIPARKMSPMPPRKSTSTPAQIPSPMPAQRTQSDVTVNKTTPQSVYLPPVFTYGGPATYSDNRARML
ncbi:hypothetical protein COOONC_18780 [Cooperia oncophora]